MNCNIAADAAAASAAAAADFTAVVVFFSHCTSLVSISLLTLPAPPPTYVRNQTKFIGYRHLTSRLRRGAADPRSSREKMYCSVLP